MDRIAEKEMERMFFPVARSAHEWNWMGVMTFLGLIHDDCVRVCDGEAMVGVMCVGPLVVVVVISVGIPKKKHTKVGSLVKLAIFRLLYFSIVWRGSMISNEAHPPVRRFRSLGTKSWRGMGLEAQDAQGWCAGCSWEPGSNWKKHQQLLDFIWCL